MNSIPSTQNSADQLRQLGAFSQLYLQAKQCLSLNLLLSVPLVLAWSIVVAIWPSLTSYAALWGAGVTLISFLVLTPIQQDKQQKAALVHHRFDCSVLELSWTAFNIGAEPDPEEIFQANAQYVKTNPSYTGLRNWYPPAVEELPIHLARLVCQRICCWWDGGLRERYAAWNIWGVGILGGVVLILGLIRGLTLERFFLAVFVPTLPALMLGLAQYREHRQAAMNLNRLRERIEEVWDRAMAGQETPQSLYEWSIRFQDKLFDNRSRNPLIFNWVYQFRRKTDQESMEHGAQAYVDEAIATLGPFNPSP